MARLAQGRKCLATCGPGSHGPGHGEQRRARSFFSAAIWTTAVFGGWRVLVQGLVRRRGRRASHPEPGPLLVAGRRARAGASHPYRCVLHRPLYVPFSVQPLRWYFPPSWYVSFASIGFPPRRLLIVFVASAGPGRLRTARCVRSRLSWARPTGWCVCVYDCRLGPPRRVTPRLRRRQSRCRPPNSCPPGAGRLCMRRPTDFAPLRCQTV